MSWRPACRLAGLHNLLTNMYGVCFMRHNALVKSPYQPPAPLVAIPRAAVWTRRAAVICWRRAAAGRAARLRDPVMLQGVRVCGRLLCQCMIPLLRPVVTNLLQLSKATRQTWGLRGLQTKDDVKASAQWRYRGSR